MSTLILICSDFPVKLRWVLQSSKQGSFEFKSTLQPVVWCPGRNTPWIASKNILYEGIVPKKCICFLCFRNKLLQTWFLKTTGIYSFIVLESRSPKSFSLCQNLDVGLGALSLNALRSSLFLVSSSSGGCWHSLAISLQSLCQWSHYFLLFCLCQIFLCLPRKDTCDCF